MTATAVKFHENYQFSTDYSLLTPHELAIVHRIVKVLPTPNFKSVFVRWDHRTGDEDAFPRFGDGLVHYVLEEKRTLFRVYSHDKGQWWIRSGDIVSDVNFKKEILNFLGIDENLTFTDKPIHLVEKKLPPMKKRLVGIENADTIARAIAHDALKFHGNNFDRCHRDSVANERYYRMERDAVKPKVKKEITELRLLREAEKCLGEHSIQIPSIVKSRSITCAQNAMYHKGKYTKYTKSMCTEGKKARSYLKKMEKAAKEKESTLSRDVADDVGHLKNMLKSGVLEYVEFKPECVLVRTSPIIIDTDDAQYADCHVCHACDRVKRRKEIYYFGRIEIEIHPMSSCQKAIGHCQGIAFRSLDYTAGWMSWHVNATEGGCDGTCMRTFREPLIELRAHKQLSSVVGLCLEFLREINVHSLLNDWRFLTHMLLRKNGQNFIPQSLKPGIIKPGS